MKRHLKSTVFALILFSLVNKTSFAQHEGGGGSGVAEFAKDAKDRANDKANNAGGQAGNTNSGSNKGDRTPADYSSSGSEAREIEKRVSDRIFFPSNADKLTFNFILGNNYDKIHNFLYDQEFERFYREKSERQAAERDAQRQEQGRIDKENAEKASRAVGHEVGGSK